MAKLASVDEAALHWLWPCFDFALERRRSAARVWRLRKRRPSAICRAGRPRRRDRSSSRPTSSSAVFHVDASGEHELILAVHKDSAALLLPVHVKRRGAERRAGDSSASRRTLCDPHRQRSGRPQFRRTRCVDLAAALLADEYAGGAGGRAGGLFESYDRGSLYPRVAGRHQRPSARLRGAVRRKRTSSYPR